jgi:hypothetical protein
MDDDHVGESAELYALGELGELESARVERHARTCEPCTRRLGEAEATVLRLIESGGVPEELPAQPGRVRLVRYAAPAPWIAAVAAAFVLGLLPWGLTLVHPPVPDADSQAPVAAMLAGHFVHAPFVGLRPDAPAAKVIYAREGGWLYVLVGAGQEPLEVGTVLEGRTAVAASLAPSNAARAVFVRAAHVDAVVLLERGAPIASAKIVYPR